MNESENGAESAVVGSTEEPPEAAEGAPAERRRRGRRGGRRHRRKEPSASPDVEATSPNGVAEERDMPADAPAPAAADDTAKSAAGEEGEAPAEKPRRPRRRGPKPRERQPVAAGDNGQTPASAAESPDEAHHEKAEVSAPAGGSSAGAATDATTADGGDKAAADPEQPPRRRRRGGRRNRPVAGRQTKPGGEADDTGAAEAETSNEDVQPQGTAPAGGPFESGASAGTIEAGHEVVESGAAPAQPQAAAAKPRRRSNRGRRPAESAGAPAAGVAAEVAAGAAVVAAEAAPAERGTPAGAEATALLPAAVGATVSVQRTAATASGADSTEDDRSVKGADEEKRPQSRPSRRHGRGEDRPSKASSSAEVKSEGAASPEATADAARDAEADGPVRGEPESDRARTRRRRDGRHQSPNLTTATAGVERTILASQEYGQLRVVMLEDGRLAEVYFQRPEKPSYLGNIYKARVESVLRGMDAAFVDFGLEKNGFLHVDEVTAPEGGRRGGRRITQLLQGGQELLVQVTKDPMGSKGARLTTRMSLPGRYLVYVPGGSGVGVSRRLPQEERDRLRDVCRQLKAKDAGLIVRTVAEGKGLEELRRDLQYLSRQWSRIRTKAEKAKAPSLVHEEVDIAVSAARDLFNESCRRFIVDSEKLRKAVTAYAQRVAPELIDRIELYGEKLPLFDAFEVEDELERTLARRVALPSGGNIVVDHAEALTIIDVNSGRYTGGSGLEDTITRTNLEAASEVVRQLRLRDIGGIIVIDFIDMERAENREAVLSKLETELARDRTKTYVVEISPLGLVEMTRQNTTDGARGILTRKCPTCQGTARILSEDTVARRVERELRLTAGAQRSPAVLIEVNALVAQRLSASDRIKRLEKQTGKRFLFQGSKTLPVDTFEIVAGGELKAVQAQCIPVAEGMELDVELEHSLTYSPKDAVATVRGYPIVVRNGRQWLGQRRRVRVETALRSGGTGITVGPATGE